MQPPLAPPSYEQGDTVRIVPLRTEGEVRWRYLDEYAPRKLRWLFYVLYRDHDGLLSGRYFTEAQLEAAADAP